MAQALELNWNKIEPIEGWLFKEEAELLFSITPRHGYVLEVGCWKGKSTNVFLQARAWVTCIDWFQGSDETPDSDTLREFLMNTRGSRIKIYPQKTQEVNEQELTDIYDVLYIDAAHDYDSVKYDFNKFSPAVMPGGYAAFHDAWGENGEEEHTPWRGVTQFVKELREKDTWKEVGKARRVAVFQRQ
jgi:predicted O-methyltransferase YrrM